MPRELLNRPIRITPGGQAPPARITVVRIRVTTIAKGLGLRSESLRRVRTPGYILVT